LAGRVNEPQAKEPDCFGQRSQSRQKSEKQANEKHIWLGKKRGAKKKCA